MLGVALIAFAIVRRVESGIASMFGQTAGTVFLIAQIAIGVWLIWKSRPGPMTRREIEKADRTATWFRRFDKR